MSRGPVTYRQIQSHELVRVGEIDRSERIDTIYVQRGVELDAVAGDFSAPPWLPEGEGEHSVVHQVEECERYLAAGGIAIGAFADGHLVGIGIVAPHVRAGVAQLAFLHVSDGYRGRGIGGRLSAQLEQLGRDLGDTVMVVSATPSANTVGFYRGRGFEPTADPLPELYELEPEDVHLEKRL
jgi:GNAT superfamily N-acetyltransferase